MLEPAARRAPVLDNITDLLRYLTVVASFGTTERVRVLYLDARLALMRDEPGGAGCISEAPIYVRPILKRALEIGAAAIVLVHNHPSGNTRPGNADLALTRSLARGADALRIDLIDHLIVSRGAYFSFRSAGLL